MSALRVLLEQAVLRHRDEGDEARGVGGGEEDVAARRARRARRGRRRRAGGRRGGRRRGRGARRSAGRRSASSAKRPRKVAGSPTAPTMGTPALSPRLALGLVGGGGERVARGDQRLAPARPAHHEEHLEAQRPQPLVRGDQIAEGDDRDVGAVLVAAAARERALDARHRLDAAMERAATPGGREVAPVARRRARRWRGWRAPPRSQPSVTARSGRSISLARARVGRGALAPTPDAEPRGGRARGGAPDAGRARSALPAARRRRVGDALARGRHHAGGDEEREEQPEDDLGAQAGSLPVTRCPSRAELAPARVLGAEELLQLVDRARRG